MIQYLFLTISAFSMVLQNSLFNLIGKKETRNGKTFSYIFFMNFICFLLFAALSLGKGGSLYSAGLGAVFGLVTMLAYFCNLQALAKGPMHITILVTTSSMVVPALSGALFFHEPFRLSKLAATAALLCFICISLKKDDRSKGSGFWTLFCLLPFALQGAIGILQKVHQTSAHSGELSMFLMTAFLFSSLLSGVAAKRSEGVLLPPKRGCLLAAVCGLCTFAMNLINLRLSGIMPAQVFFPLVNGGSIVLSSLSAVLIFGERFTRRQLAGLLGGLVSLICICIL